jgi:hypothetical protein
MWRLILKKNFYSLFILYWSLKFLYLGSKIIQIIIFILNTLRGCSMRIQICSMHIQNTPRASSAWILCSYAQFRALFCCSSDIMEAPSVALCTFKMYRELLNAHSKYGGSCSILSYRRLEQHNRPSWWKRAALAMFWMYIEQIRIRLEQL